MDKNFASFLESVNNTGDWKIQRDYTEKHVPAFFDLEEVTLDIILLVILIALLAVLPGLKNKMIKQWLKILVGLTVAAVVLCALTQKNWLHGHVYANPLGLPSDAQHYQTNPSSEPASIASLRSKKDISMNEYVNQSLTFHDSRLKTGQVHCILRVNIGLKALNVSVLSKSQAGLHFWEKFQRLGKKKEQKRENAGNRIFYNYNIHLQLIERQQCEITYKEALKRGWPNALLQAVEYLTNGYHTLYFSGPEFSWCYNFRRAGYLTTKFLIASLFILALSWTLYLKSMVQEAALGTALLGVLLLSSDLTYVIMLSQIAEVRTYDYKISEMSYAYKEAPPLIKFPTPMGPAFIKSPPGIIDTNNPEASTILNKGGGERTVFDMLNAVMFPTQQLTLQLGWSFWSVLGTGCICVAAGMIIITANMFFPHMLLLVDRSDDSAFARIFNKINQKTTELLSPAKSSKSPGGLNKQPESFKSNKGDFNSASDTEDMSSGTVSPTGNLPSKVIKIPKVILTMPSSDTTILFDEPVRRVFATQIINIDRAAPNQASTIIFPETNQKLECTPTRLRYKTPPFIELEEPRASIPQILLNDNPLVLCDSQKLIKPAQRLRNYHSDTTVFSSQSSNKSLNSRPDDISISIQDEDTVPTGVDNTKNIVENNEFCFDFAEFDNNERSIKKCFKILEPYEENNKNYSMAKKDSNSMRNKARRSQSFTNIDIPNITKMK